MRWLLAALLLTACGPTPPRHPAEHAGTARIAATERGPRGGHLVLIAEDGRRVADLTEVGVTPVVDSGAAWSPDGAWIVFASSRGRKSVAHSSLWIVPARPGAVPRPLTSSEFVDLDPTWSSDGTWLVFSSNREGSFDLWRANLRLEGKGAPALSGKPIRLTSAPTQERHPSISPDGKDVLYDAGDEQSGSAIWRVAADGGTPVRLTRGPADGGPRYSPDGTTIAFASAAVEAVEMGGKEGARVDVDLYLMDRDGANRRLLIREPYADQTGPRWSNDGRHIFATSIYRSMRTGKAVLGSIVFVDRAEKPLVLRALHDVVVETRMQPTIAPASLDAVALARNQPYLTALRQVLEDAIIDAHERGQDPAD